MGWWIIPVFIITLIHYPLSKYGGYYGPFWITFFVFAFFGIILSQPEIGLNLWNRYGIWKRYFFLVGVYTLVLVIILFITILTTNGYFGGDGGGSFMLLFFPSIMLYSVIGAVFITIIQIIRKKRISK
jgi:hypothetical protein